MAKTEKHIFHIFEKAKWAEAQASGEYTPESFAKEGFIHFSTKHQLKNTAEKYYRGQTGLGFLKVEINRLKAPLKYEKPATGAPCFRFSPGYRSGPRNAPRSFGTNLF